MICPRFVEAALSSPEPLYTLRNLLIIGSGLSAYWLGAALRLAATPGPRRLLASAVLSIPLSFLAAPPLLFLVSGSTQWSAFAGALAGCFALGAALNHRVVEHLNRHGLGL